MRITFLGAAHEVTGSCTYVECGKTRFIVDCGMEQGRDMFENQSLPISPSQVDFALLTHAHIDHSGLLPLLAKTALPAACTPPPRPARWRTSCSATARTYR